jgi:hypothetical protein
MSSIVRISWLRLTASEMDLQLLAALNIGRALLKIAELLWQTVFVSPDALAFAAFITSACRVFDYSADFFSKSPHDVSCSPHPARNSGKTMRQEAAGNLRIKPSGCSPYSFLPTMSPERVSIRQQDSLVAARSIGIT